jgi:DNA-binding transcriptional LysR family regulator
MAGTHELISPMANAANEMAVFERVVARGSFAAAADDLRLSASAISKLISRLEGRLGVRLINRTTRRLSLTADGEIYLKRCREILAAIEAAEGELTPARSSPRGHLRVHAPPVMISDHFAPALPAFLARYPRLSIEFLVANRVVDLIAENVDVSMRTGQLPDSSMIANKVLDLSQIVCASPEYLARRGHPHTPDDLAQHACLSLTSLPEPAKWQFVKGGQKIAVQVTGLIGADSSDVLYRLAEEGLGIVCLGELAVARALSNGTLVQVLRDFQVQEGYPLWALTAPGRHRSPKIRAFMEFLAQCLGRSPWRAGLAKLK